MIVNLDVEPLTEHIFPCDICNVLGEDIHKYTMGATVVAYPMSEIGDLTHVADARQVFISIAQCSERDNYNRKLGRSLAMSRAQYGEGIALRFPKGATLEVKRRMIRQIGEVVAGQ